jgi:hypothetical protein
MDRETVACDDKYGCNNTCTRYRSDEGKSSPTPLRTAFVTDPLPLASWALYGFILCLRSLFSCVKLLKLPLLMRRIVPATRRGVRQYIMSDIKEGLSWLIATNIRMIFR